MSSYYHRDLHKNLQRLTHTSKSVDECYKKMKIANITANMEEDSEIIIDRFLHS